MPKFKTRPLEVEARQWPAINAGVLPIDAKAKPFHDWMGGVFTDYWGDGGWLIGKIQTTHGTFRVDPGDWIVERPRGGFVVYPGHIFDVFMEPVT